MDNNWNQASPGSSHMNHPNMNMDWQMSAPQNPYSPAVGGLNNLGYEPQAAGGSMWNNQVMYNHHQHVSYRGLPIPHNTQMQPGLHQMNPVTVATASASRCAAMNELESLVMDPSSQRGFSPILTDLSEIANQEKKRSAVPKSTGKGSRGGRGTTVQTVMQPSPSLYVQQQPMQQQQMLLQQHQHQKVQYQQMTHPQPGMPFQQQQHQQQQQQQQQQKQQQQQYNQHQQYLRMMQSQQFGMVQMPGNGMMRPSAYSGQQQPTMHPMLLTHPVAERGRGRGGAGPGRGRGRGAATNIVPTRNVSEYQVNRGPMNAEHFDHGGRGYAMPPRPHVASHPNIYDQTAMMNYNMSYNNMVGTPSMSNDQEGYGSAQHSNMNMVYHQHSGPDLASRGYPQYPTGQATLSYPQYMDQQMSNNSQHASHGHNSPAVVIPQACSSHSAESSQHPSPPKQNDLNMSVGQGQEDPFLAIFKDRLGEPSELKQMTEQDIANELNQYQQPERSHDYHQQPMPSLQEQNPSIPPAMNRQVSSQPQVHFDSPVSALPQYMQLEQKHGSLPSQYDQNSPSGVMALQRGVVQSGQSQPHQQFDLTIYQTESNMSQMHLNQHMTQIEKHPTIANLLQSKPPPQLQQQQETVQLPLYMAPVASRSSSTMEVEYQMSHVSNDVPLENTSDDGQKEQDKVAVENEEEAMSEEKVKMVLRLKDALSTVEPVEMSETLLGLVDQLRGEDYFVLDFNSDEPVRVRDYTTFGKYSVEAITILCDHYGIVNNLKDSTKKNHLTLTVPPTSGFQSPPHQAASMPECFGEIGSPQLPPQKEKQSEKSKPTVVEKPSTAAKTVPPVKEAPPESKLPNLKTHPVMTRSDMAEWGKHKEKDQVGKTKPLYHDESTAEEEDNQLDDPDFEKTRRPGRGRGRGRGSRGGLTRGVKRGPGRPRGSGKASRCPNMGNKPTPRGKGALLSARARSSSPEFVVVKRMIRPAPSKERPVREALLSSCSQELSSEDEVPVRAPITAPVKPRVAPMKEPRKSRLFYSSDDSSDEKNSQSEPEKASKPSTSHPVLVVPPAPESGSRTMENASKSRPLFSCLSLSDKTQTVQKPQIPSQLVPKVAVVKSANLSAMSIDRMEVPKTPKKHRSVHSVQKNTATVSMGPLTINTEASHSQGASSFTTSAGSARKKPRKQYKSREFVFDSEEDSEPSPKVIVEKKSKDKRSTSIGDVRPTKSKLLSPSTESLLGSTRSLHKEKTSPRHGSKQLPSSSGWKSVSQSTSSLHVATKEKSVISSFKSTSSLSTLKDRASTSAGKSLEVFSSPTKSSDEKMSKGGKPIFHTHGRRISNFKSDSEKTTARSEAMISAERLFGKVRPDDSLAQRFFPDEYQPEEMAEKKEVRMPVQEARKRVHEEHRCTHDKQVKQTDDVPEGLSEEGKIRLRKERRRERKRLEEERRAREEEKEKREKSRREETESRAKKEKKREKKHKHVEKSRERDSSSKREKSDGKHEKERRKTDDKLFSAMLEAEPWESAKIEQLKKAAADAARRLEVVRRKKQEKEKLKEMERKKEEEEARRELRKMEKQALAASKSTTLTALKPSTVFPAIPKPSISASSKPSTIDDKSSKPSPIVPAFSKTSPNIPAGKKTSPIVPAPKSSTIFTAIPKPGAIVHTTPKPRTSVKTPLIPVKSAQLSLLDSLLDDAGAALEKKRESLEQKNQATRIASSSKKQEAKELKQEPKKLLETKTPIGLESTKTLAVLLLDSKTKTAPSVATLTSSDLVLSNEEEIKLTPKNTSKWRPPNLELSQSTVNRLVNAMRKPEGFPPALKAGRKEFTDETRTVQRLNFQPLLPGSLPTEITATTSSENSYLRSTKLPMVTDAEASTTGSIWHIPPSSSSKQLPEGTCSNVTLDTDRSDQLGGKKTDTVIDEWANIEQFEENNIEDDIHGYATEKSKQSQECLLEAVFPKHIGTDEATVLIPLEAKTVSESEISTISVDTRPEIKADEESASFGTKSIDNEGFSGSERGSCNDEGASRQLEEEPCSSASLFKTSTPMKASPPLEAVFGTLDAPEAIPNVMFSQIQQFDDYTLTVQREGRSYSEAENVSFNFMSPYTYEPANQTFDPSLSSPTRFMGARDFSIQEDPLRPFVSPSYNRDLSLNLGHIPTTIPTTTQYPNTSFYSSTFPDQFLEPGSERSVSPALAEEQPIGATLKEYEDALDELEQLAALDNQQGVEEQTETPYAEFLETAGTSESFYDNLDAVCNEEVVETTDPNDYVPLFGNIEPVEDPSLTGIEASTYEEFQPAEDVLNRDDDAAQVAVDFQTATEEYSFDVFAVEEELLSQDSADVFSLPLAGREAEMTIEEEEEPVVEEDVFSQPFMEPVTESSEPVLQNVVSVVEEESVVENVCSSKSFVEPVAEVAVEEEPVVEETSEPVVEPIEKRKRGRPKKHSMITKPLSLFGSPRRSTDSEELVKARETLSSPTRSLRSQGSTAELSLPPSRSSSPRKNKMDKEPSVDTSIASEDTGLAFASSLLSPSGSEKVHSPSKATRSRQQLAFDTSTAEEDEVEEPRVRRSGSQEARRRKEFREKRVKKKPEPTRSKEEMEEIDEIFKCPPRNAHRPGCIPEKKPRSMIEADRVEKSKILEQQRWDEDESESTSRRSSRASSRSIVQSAESESEPVVQVKPKRVRRGDTALLLGGNEEIVNELCTKGASRRTRRLDYTAKQKTPSQSPLRSPSSDSDYQPRRSKGKRRYLIESDDEEPVNIVEKSVAPEAVVLESSVPVVEPIVTREETPADLVMDELETVMEHRNLGDQDQEPEAQTTADTTEHSAVPEINLPGDNTPVGIETLSSPNKSKKAIPKRSRSEARRTSASGSMQLVFTDRRICASVEDIIKDRNRSFDDYRLSIERTENQLQVFRPDEDITHAYELHNQLIIPEIRREVDQMAVADIQKELFNTVEESEEAAITRAQPTIESDLLSTPAPTEDNVQLTEMIFGPEKEKHSLLFCYPLANKGQRVKKRVQEPKFCEMSTTQELEFPKDKMAWEEAEVVISEKDQDALLETAEITVSQPEEDVVVEEEPPADVENLTISTPQEMSEQVPVGEMVLLEPFVERNNTRSPRTTEETLQLDLAVDAYLPRAPEELSTPEVLASEILPKSSLQTEELLQEEVPISSQTVESIVDKETTVAEGSAADLMVKTLPPSLQPEVEAEAVVQMAPAYQCALFGLEPEDEQVDRPESVEVPEHTQKDEVGTSSKMKTKLSPQEDLFSAFNDIISEKPFKKSATTRAADEFVVKRASQKQEKAARTLPQKSRRASKHDVPKITEAPTTSTAQEPIQEHVLQRRRDLETLPLVLVPQFAKVPETERAATTTPKKKRHRRSQTEMLLAMGACKIDELENTSSHEEVRAEAPETAPNVVISQDPILQSVEPTLSETVKHEDVGPARKTNNGRRKERDSVALEIADKQENEIVTAEKSNELEAGGNETEKLAVGKPEVFEDRQEVAVPDDTTIQPTLYVDDALEPEYEEPEVGEIVSQKDLPPAHQVQVPLLTEQPVAAPEVKVKRPRGRPRKNKLAEPIVEEPKTTEQLADKQDEQAKVAKPNRVRGRRGQLPRSENRQSIKDAEEAHRNEVAAEISLAEKDTINFPVVAGTTVAVTPPKKKKRNEVELQSLEEAESPKRLRSRSLEGIARPGRETVAKRRSRSSEAVDDLEEAVETSFELEVDRENEENPPQSILRKRRTSGPVRRVHFEPTPKKSKENEAVFQGVVVDLEKVAGKKRKIAKDSSPIKKARLEVTLSPEPSASRDFEDRESYSPELGEPVDEISGPKDETVADKEVVVAEGPAGPEVPTLQVELEKVNTVAIDEEEEEEEEESEDDEGSHIVSHQSSFYLDDADLEDSEKMRYFFMSLQNILPPSNGYEPRLNTGDEWSHVNDGERAMYVVQEDEALSVFYVAGAITGQHSVRQVFNLLLKHDHELTDWLWGDHSRFPSTHEEMETLVRRLEYYLHEVNFGKKPFFVPLKTRYGPAVLKNCLSEIERMKYKWLMDSLSFDVNMPLMIKAALLVHLDEYFGKALAEAKTREEGKTMEHLFNMYTVGADVDMMPYVSFDGRKDDCPLAKWAPMRVKKEAWRLYYLRTMLFQIHRVIEQRMFENGWIHPNTLRILNLPLCSSITNMDYNDPLAPPRVISSDRPERAIRDAFDERTADNFVMIRSKVFLPIYGWWFSLPGFPANYMPRFEDVQEELVQ